MSKMNLTLFLIIICSALVISSDMHFNSTILHTKLNPVENFKTESYQFLLKNRISEIEKLVFKNSSVTFLLTLSDTHYLASGHRDGQIKIWNTIKGSLVRTLKGHTSSIQGLVTFKRNSQLASASHDGTIIIWDPYTGYLIKTLHAFPSLLCLSILDDDQSLASGHNLNGIYVWNLSDSSLIESIKLENVKIKSLITLNDHMLAGITDDSSIKIWKSQDWTWILSDFREIKNGIFRILDDHRDKVNCLVSLPGREMFASGSHDTTIKIWINEDNGLIRTLKGHTGSVICLTVLLDGSLSSGSDDSTIRIWNPYNGNLLKIIKEHIHKVTHLSALNDGRLLFYMEYTDYGRLKVLTFERSWDLKSDYVPQNCWSFNGNLNDSCGNAHLWIRKQVNLTNDRLGQPKSAVNLNKGLLYAPPVYFPANFTFTFWMYLRSISNWLRVIDLVNGTSVDHFVFFFYENELIVQNFFHNNSDSKQWIKTNTYFHNNKWYYVAVVQSCSTMVIYVNNKLVSFMFLKVQAVNFQNEFDHIDTSETIDSPMLDGILDEIKLFNQSLNYSGIINDFHSNPLASISSNTSRRIRRNSDRKINIMNFILTHFSGDYSVTFWMNPKINTNYSRIMYISNERSDENVIVFFDANQLVAQQSVGNFSTWIRANISIDPFIWHYFAVVQSGTEMFIYLNDTLAIRMNSDNLIYSNKMETNLISKSFGRPADIYLDEIKIFDRALE